MDGMGFNEDSFRRQGSSRLELILILMSLGLLILLAFPIYNSVKGSGFVSDYPSEEGNASHPQPQ